MNNLRLLSRGPAQRAAGEIKNTLNGVAADVHGMSAALEELCARANTQAEPAPAVDKPATVTTAPPAEVKPAGLAANGNVATEIHETVRPPKIESPASGGRLMPPQLTLPAAPDIRPQVQAVRDALVRNQQMTMSALQDMRLLLDAQSRELAELREQIRTQQNAIADSRRF